ncbi:MAG: hypothetical protein JNM17_14990 [Archangium sp.]|nr:hypothetical protein [Archangium sp.]
MKLSLALVLACATVAHAGAPVTYEWKLVTGGGRPDQLLWVMQGNAPPPRRVIETWKLVIDDSGAHFTARKGGKTVNETNTAFDESKAVLREPPPRVLSMEQVPCSAPILGNYSGTCTGAAGGPLDAPLVPLSVVVSSGGNVRKSIETLALTIFTAGLIIPGEEDTSVIAHLTPPPKKALSAELTKWKASAKKESDLPETLEVELAGARLVLAGRATPDLVFALTRRVPEVDRWSLLRLARQRGLSPEGLLSVVARLDGLPEDDEALISSALVHLDPLVSQGVRELVAGRAPTLRAQAAKLGSKTFDAEVMKLLEAGGLEAPESGALVAMLSRATRQKSLPHLLEVLPLDGSAQLLELESGERTPTQTEALLKKAPLWIERMVLAGRGTEAMRLLSFDDARSRVLTVCIERVKAEDKPRALSEALTTFIFDEERLKLLKKWNAVVPQFDVAQVTKVVSAFSSAEPSREALKLVLEAGGLEKQKAAVAAALKKSNFDDERTAILEVAPEGSVDEFAAMAAFSFEPPKVKLACQLLARKPDPEVLMRAIELSSFSKLEVLACGKGAVKAMSPQQRAKALELFHFADKDKAAALLGR